MIFALAGFLLLLSIALLVVGLRGYAIDRHPLCRKCGFDLTGKPETSTRCPECGADLSLAKAIRIGHRRRRRGALAAGIGLLVLTLAFAGVATWSAVEDFDWEQVKPTWLVIHEASDRSGGVPMIAWKELSRRLMAGELSKEQSGKIADLAVSIQGDRTRTWNGVYGDFVESAHAAGTLSDTQWNQYARQAPALSLALRTQIRRGDDLPSAIVDSGNRVGSKSGLYMRIHSLHGVGDLIDPANQGNGSSTEMLQNTGAGSSGTSLQILHKAAATAPLGERKIDVWCDIEIREGFSDKGPVLAKWKQTFPGTWTLVDADAPTVEMINDPSYRENVEGSIKVGQLDVSAKSSFVNLSLDFNNLKVPLSYDVFLRIEGKEQKFCTIAVGPGNSGEGTGGQAKLNGAKNVDVILRPNADAARNTPTMTKMWNGEITLKNVPVTYRP